MSRSPAAPGGTLVLDSEGLPVTVLTSDPEDLASRCGAHVTVIRV